MLLIENETYLYLEDDKYILVVYTGPLEVPEEFLTMGDIACVHIFEYPPDSSPASYYSPQLATIVLDEDIPLKVFPLRELDRRILYGS